jgi:hypothetical protein
MRDEIEVEARLRREGMRIEIEARLRRVASNDATVRSGQMCNPLGVEIRIQW